MQDFLKETNLQAYLDYFNRERKAFTRVRFIMATLFALLYMMAIFLLQKNIFFLGMPVVAFIGYKVPYLKLLQQKKQSDLINSYLFPEFLDSFLACLASSSENIYQALLATVPYTKGSLKKELKKLIKGIQQKNDRDDYLEFAEYMGTSEAYMVMDMIYQFSVFGVKKEALKELSEYIRHINENKVDELIQSKMEDMDKLAIGPMVILLLLIGGFAATVFLHFYFQNVVGALDVL